MDQKTSLLINRQLPEFVREDYPLFISFLEAYYEFLEQKQGTELNDLTVEAKKLRYISDVDESIDEFEDHFLNTFAVLLPKETAVDKAYLIKHILPFYLSKGSEKSFRLLFKLIFGQDAIVTYPADNILRASASKWVVENSFNVSADICSHYHGDGTTTVFHLVGEYTSNDVTVYIDNSLVTSGFKVYKEYKRIEFDTAPAIGRFIQVFYNNIDPSIFVNRKVVGMTTGLTAIIDKVKRKIINNKLIIQLFSTSKEVGGNFVLSEILECDVIVDGRVITTQLSTISELQNIQINNGGAGYKVGDPVKFLYFVGERIPSAIVSKIFTSTFDKIRVDEGGAGYQTNANVYIKGYETESELIDIKTDLIYTSSPNTANTFTVYSNLIRDIDPQNTTIGGTYSSLGGIVDPADANTKISNTLANTVFTSIGELVTITINQAAIVFDTPPQFDVSPASVLVGPLGSRTTSNTIYINVFGSLGKIVIRDGGVGYNKGDEISFITNTISYGFGAEAEITQVDSNGTITRVEFVPPSISGNVSVSSTSTYTVQGIGTSFTTDLAVGQKIWINGQTTNVYNIGSATSFNVDSYFSETFSGRKVRVYGNNLVGGMGYRQDSLPKVQVISYTGGTGANLEVTNIMGSGAGLTALLGSRQAGEIEEITIIDPGKGLTSFPKADLSTKGDGKANLSISLYPSFQKYPGKWESTDSFISFEERKLEGLDYYINYSYVISSAVEFSKYKNLIKKLIHPAGYIAYSRLTRTEEINCTSVSVESSVSKQIAGRISTTSNSTIVIGTNTHFLVSNTTGILIPGSNVIINNQTLSVNTISTNTSLNLSSNANSTLSNQIMIIV